jgi:PAS domain S-box-containing protein
MRTPGNRSPDDRELRRYLRDLAALTALPAVWAGADGRHIAESLADVLVKVLCPDFVYLRLKEPKAASAVEVTRMGQGPGLPEGGWAISKALKSCLPCDASAATVLSLPHPLEGGQVQAAVVPIGYGCEFGAAAAASGRPGFPTEGDRLLLGVAANQAAVVLQRQQAEQTQRLLAAIIASSEDAIVSKTLDGVITSWNDGAERLFDYTAAEAVGQPITLIIPPDRRDEERLILERLRRGERLEHYETIRQSKQGRLINVSLTTSPVRDGAGRITGASKVARDITARVKAEAALREADRRKDEFLATLAHELRNPLAPIRNAVEVLRRLGPPEPQLQWARDVIDRQVEQMTRLVDDLLDVSRISRGKVVLRKEAVDLAAVVSRAVETTRPLIEERRHELTVSLPPKSIRLVADPARLGQILSNLLTNAAKYTGPSGRIWLMAEREQESVAVRVRDTGIGMTPDFVARAFEMFTQAEQGKDHARGGLGIGLSLVRSLAEMHGGGVTAQSPGLNQGSEFTVRLPLAAEERRAGGKAPGDARKQRPQGPARRILIVEDNKDAAQSLAMLLRLMGNDVHASYDGPSALEAAGAYRPDVVLVDIGLPGMSGHEVARRLRQQPGLENVALVAVTGWGQEEDRRLSREAGFDSHMVKPIDLDSLQELLAALKTAGVG